MVAEIRTVDDYLASLSPEQRAVLERVRRTIKKAAPDAEERISYRIPLYRQHGDVVGFAAFKDHLSLFVTDSSVSERFADELNGFEVRNTTIHFSVENPLPDELIGKIVRYRVEQNEQAARQAES
jgi:uncharacterized protein YdhG (YjbR/CyaY superfamily)